MILLQILIATQFMIQHIDIDFSHVPKQNTMCMIKEQEHWRGIEQEIGGPRRLGTRARAWRGQSEERRRSPARCRWWAWGGSWAATLSIDSSESWQRRRWLSAPSQAPTLLLRRKQASPSASAPQPPLRVFKSPSTQLEQKPRTMMQ